MKEYPVFIIYLNQRETDDLNKFKTVDLGVTDIFGKKVNVVVSIVTEDTKTPENPQNVCPAKSCHVNGTVPLSGDSPDAKGREMSCVERNDKP